MCPDPVQASLAFPTLQTQSVRASHPSSKATQLLIVCGCAPVSPALLPSEMIRRGTSGGSNTAAVSASHVSQVGRLMFRPSPPVQVPASQRTCGSVLPAKRAVPFLLCVHLDFIWKKPAHPRRLPSPFAKQGPQPAGPHSAYKVLRQ